MLRKRWKLCKGDAGENGMIKAIFFDLDGTLLDSQKRISENSRAALRACKDKGIRLFVATARPPILDRMLNWTKEEFGLFDGGIYCNGGCQKMGKVTEYTYIPENIVSYCVSQVEEYERLNIALQMENEVHAFNHPLADFAYDLWGIDKEDARNISSECKKRTVKILIYFENIVDTVTELPKDLVDRLQKYCGLDAKFYLTDQGKVIQITNKMTSKYNSIENIRKILKIKKSEVAVFGDDMNDIEMLSGYENGVAMENSGAEVKSSVRFITKSNDEDGIVYALENLLHVL